VQFKKFILVIISSSILLASLNANSLSWGQIISGAGTVGKSWNDEEQKHLNNRRLQLEVERMNREAEIQKLEYQKRMQQLQQPNKFSEFDLFTIQNQFAQQIPLKVDNDTVLSEAKVVNYGEFLFVFRLINNTVSDLDIVQFQTGVSSSLRKSACLNEFWNRFVRDGGILIYSYVDKNNAPVTSIKLAC
jgi:hypothetical protein